VSDAQFVRRVLIASGLVAAVAAFAALLVRHPELPLLAFVGVLAAIFLDALARPLVRRFRWPRALAVGAVLVLLLGGIALTGWLIGPQIADQGRQLYESLPQTFARAEEMVPDFVADGASDASGQLRWESIAPYAFGSVAGLFSTSIGVVAGTVAVLGIASFLAIRPTPYRRGLLLLVPAAHRERLAGVLDDIAHALRRWLVGRAIAMAIVAVVTYVGLALLGMPLALSLGLIAGVLTFVPYVGAVLAALPAILVALAQSPELALGVTGLYWGVQLLENYLVTPIVQDRAASLPPALLILAQLAVAVLLGGLGLLVATPLAIAVIVLVQSLYVQDVLGDEVRVLGQPDDERSADAPRRGERAAPVPR
jgi:predicted PurR-regulated permease PerM